MHGMNPVLLDWLTVYPFKSILWLDSRPTIQMLHTVDFFYTHAEILGIFTLCSS